MSHLRKIGFLGALVIGGTALAAAPALAFGGHGGGGGGFGGGHGGFGGGHAGGFGGGHVFSGRSVGFDRGGYGRGGFGRGYYGGGYYGGYYCGPVRAAAGLCYPGYGYGYGY